MSSSADTVTLFGMPLKPPSYKGDVKQAPTSSLPIIEGLPLAPQFKPPRSIVERISKSGINGGISAQSPF